MVMECRDWAREATDKLEDIKDLVQAIIDYKDNYNENTVTLAYAIREIINV